MAKVKDATLSVAGSDEPLVMSVDVEIDWGRGGDEVYAEVELLARSTNVRTVKTNTVKGDLAG